MMFALAVVVGLWVMDLAIVAMAGRLDVPVLNPGEEAAVECIREGAND